MFHSERNSGEIYDDSKEVPGSNNSNPGNTFGTGLCTSYKGCSSPG